MKLLNLVTSKSFAFLCFICGILSFALLSQLELSQRTYMSENALLVGLIKQQFTNVTAINQFYRMYMSVIKDRDSNKTVHWLKSSMQDIGLDTGIQKFTFQYDKLLNGQKFEGQNVYGILRSPGAARMQAILITVPLRYGSDGDKDNGPLLASVACVLALAQHSRNKLYWAMDIIFLFTDMEFVGMKAWLNGYHGERHPRGYIVAGDLFPRSGSLLAGLNVEIANQNVAYLEFKVESLNGQLPNLDLFNALVRLAMDSDIPVRVHGVPSATSDAYSSRVRSLTSMASMMLQQASGSPSGLHGLLAHMQIPAVTIYAHSHSQTRTNLYDITRLIETALRSLNSLQERLHQSFFFYLLPGAMRYVSIGLYMPAAGVMVALPLLLPIVRNLQGGAGEKLVDGDWRAVVRVVGVAVGAGLSASLAMDRCLLMRPYVPGASAETTMVLAAVLVTAAAAVAMWALSGARNLSASTSTVSLLQTVTRLSLGIVLSSLAVLNISLCCLLALPLVPLSLLTGARRPHHRLALMATLVVVALASPPSTVALAAMFRTRSTVVEQCGQWLLQAWTERDLLGSWTADLVTMAYLPLWLLHWAIALVAVV